MTFKAKVKEAFKSDVGRGIARLDPDIFEKEGLKIGDALLIEGKGKAVALALPSYSGDRGTGIIRLDGTLRHNAGTSIDEVVTITKTELKQAKEILLSPTQQIDFHPDFVDYVKEKLINVPLLSGNSVIIDVLGDRLPLKVVKTKPSGLVQVTWDTKLTISKKPISAVSRATGVRYEDIGGLKKEIEAIREMVEIPLKYPEVFQKLGISPPKGILLYGPPGTGKTLLAKAVANETDAHFILLNGPEIMSKYYGQSEENLRNVFKEAKENAPSIIFIDEIDAIAPAREEVSGEVEKRVVSQLLTLMDGLEARGDVIVIAATNRPDAVDPALRRPGRFDRELYIGMPNREARKEILQIHTRGMPLVPEWEREKVLLVLNEIYKENRDKEIKKLVEKIENIEEEKIENVVKESKYYEEVKKRLIDKMLEELSELTSGYTGADLAALCKEAAMKALREVIPDLKKLEDKPLSKEILDKIVVKKRHFEEALKLVEPSAMREFAIEIPKVRWDDIGGLEEIKQQLKEVIEWPLKYREFYEQAGIEPPKGILLYGPPGTGKTLLAKAVANEANANFISVKGPELLSKWVGESEKGIRKIFKRARQVAPSIIFFDEIDSLVPSRGSSFDSGVTERVTAQLLTELDGIGKLKDVVVIAATNRPDLLDKALLRPGRLDYMIYVGMPDKETRKKILEVHTRGMPLGKDVDLEKIAEMTENYNGAELAAIAREAAMFAIRETIKEGKKRLKEIKMKHFKKALERIKPQFTKEDEEQWKEITKKMQALTS